jgi:beta-lysine 5,6-aminomutase alpha subunit
MSTLRIEVDENKVRRARRAAELVTGQVQEFIDRHTTVTIERTVARFFGIDGVDADGVPLPNVVTDNVRASGQIDRGVALPIARAMNYHDLSAQEVAEAVSRRAIDLTKVPTRRDAQARELAEHLAATAVGRVRESRAEREAMIGQLPPGPPPLLYVIVATGNIHEDAVQAQAAARQGAGVIAVIRTTGQSLLDYVPYGVVSGGFGGTYATQEHFRIMRAALDDVSREIGRYVRLVNYASGLCMPEIAAMGALERLDMMLNDAMYGVLFRDINMKRTFVDQFFSRVINACAGMIINTGEDNYMTTADPLHHGHTVLASQFINEQFAVRCGLEDWQIGLGHVFAMDPSQQGGMLLDLAQAALTRAVFPGCTLKYMPQTRHKTGDIFGSYAIDMLHDLVGVATGQDIILLGMLTEAVHTPYLHDRFLALEAARYVMRTAGGLGGELDVRPGGKIAVRAAQVLDGAAAMLEHVASAGLMPAIEQGLFAGIRRQRDGGKGLEGVVEKAPGYFNPLVDLMLTCNRSNRAHGAAAGGERS